MAEATDVNMNMFTSEDVNASSYDVTENGHLLNKRK